jgi:hypothetical protein
MARDLIISAFNIIAFCKSRATGIRVTVALSAPVRIPVSGAENLAILVYWKGK